MNVEWLLVPDWVLRGFQELLNLEADVVVC